MLDWLKKIAINKYAASIIRTALVALGVYLTTRLGIEKGIVDAFIQSTTELLLSLLPIVIAQVWSLIEKARR